MMRSAGRPPDDGQVRIVVETRVKTSILRRLAYPGGVSSQVSVNGGFNGSASWSIPTDR